MALDLEYLLAPVNDEDPAGPDLSYDPLRTQIEEFFQSSVSIDVTGQELEEVGTEWRNAIEMIEAQSAQTKDLWLAIYLARAGAKARQIDTVGVAAEFLAGLCERYWETMHPKLEEYGFQGRKGPCESLTRPAEFLQPFAAIPLIEHPRLGSFGGGDIVTFHSDAEGAEGYGMFRATLEELGEKALVEATDKVTAIRAAFKRADDIMTANAEGDTATNWAPTYALLDSIATALKSFTSQPAEEMDSAGADGAGSGAAGQPRAGSPIAGAVNSREDVVRAIDLIADYYRRAEPSSPVPVLLQRAREWVNLDYLSILADISPNGIDEARRVLEFRKSEY